MQRAGGGVTQGYIKLRFEGFPQRGGDTMPPIYASPGGGDEPCPPLNVE